MFKVRDNSASNFRCALRCTFSHTTFLAEPVAALSTTEKNSDIFFSKLDILLLTPKSAITGFPKLENALNYLIINHLLIFKIYVYREGENGLVNFIVL